jgi:hypothetical protein
LTKTKFTPIFDALFNEEANMAMRTISTQQIDEIKSYLGKVLTLIASAREEAWERQDKEFGDDSTVMGLRAHKNFALQLVGTRGQHEWNFLKVSSPRGRLTLQIILHDQSSIVLRVWRANDPKLKAEEKRMIVAADMGKNLDLFATNDGQVDRWGVVYQTNAEGLLDSAYLIGYNSTSRKAVQSHLLTATQIIPLGLAGLGNEPPEPVIQQKAVAKLKLPKAAKGNNDDQPPEDGR